MILDSQLDITEHLQQTLFKVSKITSFLWKLYNVLPRSSLLTIFKSFMQPLLDYSVIIYDQAYNAYFHQKLEMIQYNTALAITGTIKGIHNF